jgi:hypothetical protein
VEFWIENSLAQKIDGHIKFVQNLAVFEPLEAFILPLSSKGKLLSTKSSCSHSMRRWASPSYPGGNTRHDAT